MSNTLQYFYKLFMWQIFIGSYLNLPLLLFFYLLIITHYIHKEVRKIICGFSVIFKLML